MFALRRVRPWLIRVSGVIGIVAVLASGVQPALADGGGFVPVKPKPTVQTTLSCRFTTQAPAPGATVDRRFQEIRIAGVCNRQVKQVPIIFVDGVRKTVLGAGVTNPFRFAGQSSLVNIAEGAHTLKVVVTPREKNVRPFVRTWTFFAR